MIRHAKKALLAGLLGGAILTAPAAYANKYGMRRITQDTVLRDHQFGAVIFDADDITLDCAGKQVHISSHSKPNCGDDGSSKCGIVANHRSNVTIKNCRVVGGFDMGVALANTVDSTVTSVETRGPDRGFMFLETERISASNLVATESEYGLYISHDRDSTFQSITSGSNRVGVWGWQLRYSTLEDIWIEQVEDGFVGYNLFDTTFRRLHVQQASDFGFFSQHSDRILLEGSEFEGLGGIGISLHDTSDSSIYENDSLDNEEMDACQDQFSDGNHWEANVFGTWCSSVPDQH